MRSRVRESLVREGVRANLLAGVTPSEAAIVDAAAARGVEVVRLRPWREQFALREGLNARASAHCFSAAKAGRARSTRLPTLSG